MKRLVLLAAALGALGLAGSTAAAPTAPTGEPGACNMVNAGALNGMENAVEHANQNGFDGMVTAIVSSTQGEYGQPPDYCP
ncbi:MAG TPA: hypothetical protein VFK76_06600 [Gaiellaceae bacterium]|nr:hypothetical protein [Gaiellaceae bacterium]